jgi:hypothetical protein
MNFMWPIVLVLLINSSYTGWSQKQPVELNYFAGSTPCDSFIKTRLKIPETKPCDFIKWSLVINTQNDKPGTFQLTALYGESKSNTNGFIGGGTLAEATGSFVVTQGTPNGTQANAYLLQSNSFDVAIELVRMDENIFHFADGNKNLLVGNGGYSYVLNRTKRQP